MLLSAQIHTRGRRTTIEIRICLIMAEGHGHIHRKHLC